MGGIKCFWKLEMRNTCSNKKAYTLAGFSFVHELIFLIAFHSDMNFKQDTKVMKFLKIQVVV